jgi:high-affinity iron transporter
MVFSSFLITSRETLEAALVVGIVMAYLTRTGNHQYKKTVYYGITFGIFLSIVTAAAFTLIAGGFEGAAEGIFEGFTMLFAAVLLTTMILWMMRQKQVAKEIQSKVASHIEKANFNSTYAYGLFALVAVAILREGVETVIFFQALSYSSGVSLIGGLLGVLSAILIGYLFFVGSRKINLKKFFSISSILLILVAAGLVAHGIHELQEAAVLPVAVEHLWNTNAVLNEEGLVGSFLKGLFGYNGNPSLLEVLFYAGYLAFIFYLYFRIEKTSRAQA